MSSPLTIMLDQYLKGLPNEENLKEVILGLFAIGSSKETLEALYGLKGTEKEFHDRVERFFLSEISPLSEDQRMKLLQTLTNNNSRVMQQILSTFLEHLPQDSKEIVQKNIQTMKENSAKETVDTNVRPSLGSIN
jgi:hypothetical protein